MTVADPQPLERDGILPSRSNNLSSRSKYIANHRRGFLSMLGDKVKSNW